MDQSTRPRMPRKHRVAGALIGSVVGDALGAPFEFGPAGRFSARFPMRWTSAVNGRVPGFASRDWRLADLQVLAARLSGEPAEPYEPPGGRGIEPRAVTNGVWASDLEGARNSSTDFAVVSLCRTG